MLNNTPVTGALASLLKRVKTEYTTATNLLVVRIATDDPQQAIDLATDELWPDVQEWVSEACQAGVLAGKPETLPTEEALYSLTSLENWEKYEDTGDNKYLNDIRPEEKRDKPTEAILAWEGGCIRLSL